MNLLSIKPTTAIATTATTPVNALKFFGAPSRLTLVGNFVYGSGGTSVDVYVQTTFDEGATWSDIAQFHFLTTSVHSVYNLSALTAKTTLVALTDGLMTANTSLDGAIGSQLRVKYTSSGTYATTSVDIWAIVG